MYTHYLQGLRCKGQCLSKGIARLKAGTGEWGIPLWLFKDCFITELIYNLIKGQIMLVLRQYISRA